MKRRGNILSAALLLAGACIGTGYYAIPVSAGPAGFFPAAVMTLIVWIYLFATGLLYLEATLACPDGANVISISKRLVGRTGMVIAAISFVIINYFFLSNFYFLGRDFLSHFFEYWLHLTIPKVWFLLALTVIFGGVVFWGTYAASRLNFILFIGMFVAFFGAIFIGAEGVSAENLLSRQWYLVIFSVPIIVTAIDYQSLIPTLSTYLNRDPKRLVKMIFIALLFPLVMYISWIWLTIGSTPRGELWQAYEQKKPIYEGFLILSGRTPFQFFFHFTSFFAIATSLIATGLAATDFLCDAFKIPVEKRTGSLRLYACSGVYVPGLLICILIPIAALQSMGYLVGWAEVIFNGAIPIWLATRARYILKLEMKKILPGGKVVIFILIIATFFLIYLEGVHILGG